MNTVPVSSSIDLLDHSSYKESLFENGEAMVYSVDQQKNIPISIEKSNGNNGIVFFYAYEYDNNYKLINYLGYIKIDWIRNLDDGTYGSIAHPRLDKFSSYYHDGLEYTVKAVNKIVVVYIVSLLKSQYKGVGTALMQAAMEYGYSKDCEGRVVLDAVGDSHGFYYKLGMRTRNPNTDKKIAWMIEVNAFKEPTSEVVSLDEFHIKNLNDDSTSEDEGSITSEFAIPHNGDFGSHIMYMPENGRVMWKQRIDSNEIFKEALL